MHLKITIITISIILVSLLAMNSKEVVDTKINQDNHKIADLGNNVEIKNKIINNSKSDKKEKSIESIKAQEENLQSDIAIKISQYKPGDETNLARLFMKLFLGTYLKDSIISDYKDLMLRNPELLIEGYYFLYSDGGQVLSTKNITTEELINTLEFIFINMPDKVSNILEKLEITSNIDIQKISGLIIENIEIFEVGRRSAKYIRKYPELERAYIEYLSESFSPNAVGRYDRGVVEGIVRSDDVYSLMNMIDSVSYRDDQYSNTNAFKLKNILRKISSSKNRDNILRMLRSANREDLIEGINAIKLSRDIQFDIYHDVSSKDANSLIKNKDVVNLDADLLSKIAESKKDEDDDEKRILYDLMKEEIIELWGMYLFSTSYNYLDKIVSLVSGIPDDEIEIMNLEFRGAAEGEFLVNYIKFITDYDYKRLISGIQDSEKEYLLNMLINRISLSMDLMPMIIQHIGVYGRIANIHAYNYFITKKDNHLKDREREMMEKMNLEYLKQLFDKNPILEEIIRSTLKDRLASRNQKKEKAS